MIYIVSHIPYEGEVPTGYKVMYVGDMYKESGKDNINHLNPYLNELTALYDIWKNKKDKTVGLCHYRRFFTMNGHILKSTEATQLLKTSEIITVFDIAPLKLDTFLETIISKPLYDKYVSQFPEGFQKWLREAKGFNPCNMFICNKKLINEYCEHLFPMIIPMAEQFIQEDASKEGIDTRALGRIAEMYFAYWCKDKKRQILSFEMV